MSKLSISFVMDGEKKVAVEITDNVKTWFYAFDQAYWPGMRLGPFPRKSLDEEYQRKLVIELSDVSP